MHPKLTPKHSLSQCTAHRHALRLETRNSDSKGQLHPNIHVIATLKQGRHRSRPCCLPAWAAWTMISAIFCGSPSSYLDGRTCMLDPGPTSAYLHVQWLMESMNNCCITVTIDLIESDTDDVHNHMRVEIKIVSTSTL
jgi:hypothetical protein